MNASILIRVYIPINLKRTEKLVGFRDFRNLMNDKEEYVEKVFRCEVI